MEYENPETEMDKKLVWGPGTGRYKVEHCNHIWDDMGIGQFHYFKCKLCGILKWEELVK